MRKEPGADEPRISTKSHSKDSFQTALGQEKKILQRSSQGNKQKEPSALVLSTSISHTHVCFSLQLVPPASLSQKMIY